MLSSRQTPEDVAAEASAKDASPPQPEEPKHRVREIRRGSPLQSQSPRPAAYEEEDAVGASETDAPRAEPATRRGNAERGDDDRPAKSFYGRGLDLFGLRRRLGFGRDDAAPTDEGTTEAAEAAPRSAPVSAPARQRVTASDGTEVVRQAAASTAQSAPAVGVAEHEARAEASTRHATPLFEEDIDAVGAYLARPDVPAIVRAERVAEELGLAVERADGALDRISENSEHLSRIRAGAYMLRRRGEG